ncbi:MAG TPA: AAA family ATPase, partial [Pyrinomonadaceae bacterium]
MFKLQRLEITGFKSFADYTEIVFTGSGITAVVGPNGCGKSNVSESIAWVLGEQRAKALRGGEMKDVVFQGTRSRKPSGMAEVVLHLVRDEESFFSDEEDLSGIDVALSDLDENALQIEDFEAQQNQSETESAEFSIFDSQLVVENGFHAEETETAQAAQVGSVQTIQQKTKTKRHWRPRNFALEYAPGEAVSVTRRLYLSGESEYQLNGKTCRLRDIQDLFAGTGLSGAHYAIVEQGRIGQILSAKPSDRRNLIEEAAGISKFRTRQRAAETRLESAKTNLNRISDIVSEIDKQANALRRQAAKTRRYKLLREEFRVLLKRLFAAEGRDLSELVDELENKLTEAVAIERRLFAEVAEKDETFRVATAQARAAEEHLAQLRQTHSENALERDRASREHRYQTEQIAAVESRRAVLSDELESAELRRRLLAGELEKLLADERKERVEAERNELALREAEAKYREKSGELNKIETELEKERAEHLRHAAAVERFAEIERQLENNLERLRERGEGLQRESARAEENRREHRAEADNLAAEVAAENEKLKKLHAEKQLILAAAGETRAQLRGAEDVLKNLRNEFSRKRNRLETLQELEEKRAVYAPQVQKLFDAQSRMGVKFMGILADALRVEEKAEKAVENLFGSYLQSVLVESDEEARKTIAFLNENNIGRIGVLVISSETHNRKEPKEKKEQKKEPKNVGEIANSQSPMIEFLGLSDEFADVLTGVFPRETAARLVEDFADVSAESDEILVDYSGDLLMGGKLFVGGKSSAGEKNNSVLAFKRELRELEKDSRRIQADAEKAEKETEKARAALAEKEEKILDLQSLIVKMERDTLGLEIREKSARQEIERAERHQKVVADETLQIEKELALLK